MTDITTLLDRLADLQAQADLLALDYQAQRDAAIPPEVRQTLADIDAEMQPAIEAARAGVDALTAEIKAAVLAHGATVKGERLQAVWAKGRVSWDTKALDGYAAGHPEIVPFRKEGDPSVSIRGAK